MSESLPVDLEGQEYVLGTNDEELARLGFQHQVWGEIASRTWERAGFSPGHTLLDAGCGPGYSTFGLARLAGAEGKVVAVDKSQRFITYLNSQIKARGVENISAQVGDLENLHLPPSSVDGAYARWVFCFLERPQAAISEIAKTLQTGAAFAIQDYSNYRAFDIYPDSAVFNKVYEAVWESWKIHGSYADIGRRLPEMMSSCGLEVTHIEPIIRIARPGSALWKWPETFFISYMPTLVEMGLITEEDREEFIFDWRKRSQNPNAVFTTPVNVEVIGIKR